MNLTYDESEQAFRADARAWLGEHVPSPVLPSGDTRQGFALHVEWERLLFSAGWSVVSWPERYGGRGASLWEWLIFEEEYYRAEAPQRVTQNGIFLLAPTLMEFGSQEQRDRVLPPMAAARQLWCQGWSEPGAGSDLAAIASTAARSQNDGGWLLSGHKTWTTRGGFCTHLFGLFRSAVTSERHQGLTYFMVPLNADGVTVRPFGRLDGDEGFADVYFDEVFVPDQDVIGPVGAGWSVAMSTASSERGLTLRSPGRFLSAADRLVRLARERIGELTPAVVDAVAGIWIDAQAYQAYTLRQVSEIARGTPPGASSSINKIFWSELDLRLHRTALDVLGPEAELDGAWARGFLFSLAGPIYAGTNEIQRTIVAERLLGLPRR